ncbi:MAG TPA: EAL domain-containing protein [Xanthobacteraceae bacterium]|nr:EAL domain-containing protein [Xanthobacteraceae bacterium]
MRKYRSHLFVLGALAAVLLTGMPDALKNALTDLRSYGVPRPATRDIVIVAIDSRSIEAIGVWPWPRQLHAELIGKLEDAKASDIVFDVDFSAPSNPASDQAFLDALKKAGGSVVLPSFKQLADGRNQQEVHLNLPLRPFGENSWPAIVNVSAEPNGVVRRYPYGEIFDGKFLPSMAAVLAGRHHQDKEPFWIDFSIRADSIPMVSYVDVLRGDPAVAKRLENKKIIIGGMALELGDRFNIPTGQIVSGPLLQALAAESILQGRTLRPTSELVRLSGPVFVALLMAAFWRRSSAVTRATILVASAIAAEAGAMLLQAKLAIMADTSLLNLAAAAYLIAIALDEINFRGLVGRIAERRFLRIAMSLGDGLVCTDQNSLITVWNPGATALFGYKPEEMIGQPLERICTIGSGDPTRNRFSVLDLPAAVLQSPGGQIMELDGHRKNGEVFPLEACFSGWQGTDGFQYGAILRDISVRKREAERIRYLAEHDTITGLPNRNALHVHLGTRFFAAKPWGTKVALLVVGVDKFELINDMLGHAYGDQVLCAVAKRLSSVIGATDLVARLDGDEFAIVLSGADAADRAVKLSERAYLAFEAIPLMVTGRQQSVRICVGVAVYPKDCETADELLGNAHLALGRAKAARRGKHVLFERGMRDELEARLTLEAELGLAADRNEFELFYQPQVSLTDGRLTGAEALIRWRHPERGLVSPADFMPVVNTSPISVRVAFWVMETACRQALLWQRMGHNVRISVNLSASQLQSGDLVTTLATVLRRTGCPAALLELEVTEDILIVDDEKALEIFRRIQDLGVRIVFDDFGTGYASLSYLKKFPLDGLKIDKYFVHGLQADADDAAIVGSTISLSKVLGLSVVAEGIEDGATADLLASLGCEQGQGFYFGHPMPAQEFEQNFLSNDALTTPGISAAKRIAGNAA